MMKSQNPFQYLPLFALLVLMTASCAKVNRERTLPPSIRSVYVPMAVNRTAEPGIEEDITVYVQKEFLADGRLEIEDRRRSDAHIIITITDFESTGRSFDTDNYARRIRQRVTAKVEILQNKPDKPPFGPPRDVVAVDSFNNDARTVNFEPKPHGRDEVLQEIAREIVKEVITGRFENL